MKRALSSSARTTAPTVLAVGAHPDDIELGVGALVATLSDAGVRVVAVDLTNGEPTPFGTPKKRAEEAKAASKILGIDTRICLQMPNRELFDSIAHRKKLAAVIRSVQPTLILTHYWTDVHPDHVAACAITEGARFVAKLSKYAISGEPFFAPQILYYGSLHNRIRSLPAVIVDSSPGAARKIASIKAYKSQFEENKKNRAVPDRLHTEGQFWGAQINAEFGEPLFSKDPVGISAMGLFSQGIIRAK